MASKVYDIILPLVRQGQFKSAYEKLSTVMSKQTVDVERSKYIVFSNKNSPYFSSEKAEECLVKLASMDDSWAIAERGRCYLFGILGKQDSYKAEDLFINVEGREPMADYYRAMIHMQGLHKNESGEPVFDLKESINILKKLIAKNTPFKNKAMLSYCDVQIKLGRMNPQEKSEVFNILSGLVSDKPDKEVHRIYMKFLTIQAHAELQDYSLKKGSGKSNQDKADYDSANKMLNKLISIYN
jgi:hypothetical protein